MSFSLAKAAQPYLYHPEVASRAPHGFFTAEGGVSSGVYASLNCGYGSSDDAALVRQNRDVAAAALCVSGADLAAVYQVHGHDCIVVDEPTPTDRDSMKRADGMVTTRPGLALTILTADCLPLLLTSGDGAVVGACHAGWRGAAAGIVDATIAAMRDAGASDIIALIGPTIRQPSYQVGGDMRDEVISMLPAGIRDAGAACFLPDPADDAGDRFRFDLPRLVYTLTKLAGVTKIHDCGVDTYPTLPDSPAFFSHRRATHAGMKDCGRQVSMIRRHV